MEPSIREGLNFGAQPGSWLPHTLNIMLQEYKLSHISVSFLRLHFPKTPCPQTSAADMCPPVLPSPWGFPWFQLADIGLCPLYVPGAHLCHCSYHLECVFAVWLVNLWGQGHVSSSLCLQGIRKTLNFWLDERLNLGIWRNSPCAAIGARD